MITCLDVDYTEDTAHAAGVGFPHWTDAVPAVHSVVRIDDVQPYEPGQFYRRELPCLLQVLRTLPAASIVIIDGYVWLDGPGKAGLGAHLHNALGGKIPVIGVAKTAFRNAHDVCEVLRGDSQRPLFVSAAGLELAVAAGHVRSMHGTNRIPTLLKEVDRLARARITGPTSGPKAARL